MVSDFAAIGPPHYVSGSQLRILLQRGLDTGFAGFLEDGHLLLLRELLNSLFSGFHIHNYEFFTVITTVYLWGRNTFGMFASLAYLQTCLRLTGQHQKLKLHHNISLGDFDYIEPNSLMRTNQTTCSVQ